MSGAGTSPVELVRECATALLQLRCVGEGAAIDGELLRERMIALVDAFAISARKIGISQRDGSDIQYALVAVSDEVASRRGGTVTQVWMQRPLQMHYFNENVAGEGFFTRLETLIADPRRVETLKVYYLCLLLGFEGRYATSGNRMELDSIRARTKECLGDWATTGLISVRPDPPAEDQLVKRRLLPVVWVGGFALLFATSVMVSLMGAIDADAADLVAQLGVLIAR
ncbi:MAG: DotU family type IV/VI secretion system protein [Nannocystaceae bacterium]